LLEYLELKIRVTSDGAGGFRTYADGPSGVASGEFVPPFSDEEVDKIVGDISEQIGRGTRRAETPEDALVKHFGGVLFDALFEDEIRDLYYGSLRAAQDQRKGLRITLALTNVPKLLLVPWEYLYDEPNFLVISDFTPIVRYLDLRRTRDPIEIERPLRILAMVSSPKRLVELDVEQEQTNIDRALARLKAEGAVDITWLEEATLDELMRCLRDGGPYHVFHYIGHGEYDDEREDGVLFLEDERGRPDAVSGLHLGATLLGHTSLRLATLNACDGGRGAGDDPFAGVASSLVQSQIPAVVAMQFPITDRMAARFSKWFYESLAAGYPVDRALAQARLAMFNKRSGIEWGTPVLFMRQDGRIFDIPDRRPITHVRWWRRWRWNRNVLQPVALAAALIVVVAAVSAYALLRDGGGQTQISWSVAPIPGISQALDVAAAGGDSAVVVGKSGTKPVVRRYEGGSWVGETVEGGSGAMNAVVVTEPGGTALAAGNVVYEQGNVDAGIWRREGGSWEPKCGYQDCGDAAPGAVEGRQAILGMTVTSSGSIVAVGNEKPRDGAFHVAVWRSEDGSAWERVRAPGLSGAESQSMSGVAAIGDRLVAVGRSGRDGAAWTSEDDGVQWTKVPGDDLDALGRSVNVAAVYSTGSGLVAVGSERPQKDQRAGAAGWFSDAGLSWSSANVENVDYFGQGMADVVTTPEGLFAVGADLGKQAAAVWRSTDGREWRGVSSKSFSDGKSPGMRGIALLDDGILIAVGTATDGQGASARSWTADLGQ
jgi:hypothetical protein